MTRNHPTLNRASNRAALSTLLDIATLFRTEAPWSDMELLPPVAVKDLAGGETAYCTMLRSHGHSCVFMVYLGESGLQLWLDDLTGRIDPDSPVERLGLEDVPEEHIDVQLLFRRFHGYLINFNEPGTPPIHRRHRFPTARTSNAAEKHYTSFEVVAYPKGEDSREPRADEIDRVGEILIQLQSVAETLRIDGEAFIAARGVNELWTLSPTFDSEKCEVRWEGAWEESLVSIMEIDEQRLMAEEAMLDEAVVERSRRSIGSEEMEQAILEQVAPSLRRGRKRLMVMTTPEPIRVSAIDKPRVMKRVLALISLPEQRLVGGVTLDNPEIDGGELRIALLKLMIGLGEVPAALVVGEESLEEDLVSLSQSIGFEIERTSQPKKLRTKLSEKIAAHFREVAEGKQGDSWASITKAELEMQGPMTARREPSRSLRDIITHLDRFCEEHGSATIYQEGVDLAAYLDIALSPTPLHRGRPEHWACAITCHVLRNNSNDSRDGDRQAMTLEDICNGFDVSEETVHKRMELIEQTLGETVAVH